MITHTPRADPVASASTSRNSPSQHRSPITPGRYRAAPSINHAFPSPSSSRSRRSSIVESADTASPSNSSSSNWQASIELSLTTRRRLIRKPLPQIPSSHNADSSFAHGAVSGLIAPAALDAQCQLADAWWPASLPHKQPAPPSSNPRSPNNASPAPLAAAGQPQPDQPGLDDQSLHHLLTILHYAALRSDPPSEVTKDDGTIGRNNVVISATGTYKRQSHIQHTAASASMSSEHHTQYVLDQATLDSLYRALLVAFRYLSQKQVLGALQRTASIRWRAEAQLRNATAAQAAEASSASSSRWTRFAWPAAALGKAYKEAQRSILPPLPGQASSAGLEPASQFHMGHDAYAGLYLDPDHRIRKRDVAVKILSNAIWFVRNYGPAAGVETLDGAAADSAALDQASSELDHADQIGAGDPTPPSLSSIRRTSENLLKKNAGLPNFLSKSSATTALSGTATPDSSRADSPAIQESAAGPPSAESTLDAAPIASSMADPRHPAPLSDVALDSATPAPDSSPSDPLDAPAKGNSAGEKSKAVEHLASLSAAVGAAMRQRAQQATTAAAAHGGLPEDWIDARPPGASTLHHQPSRPSLRSFVSRSEAEAAETDALEKAERDYLAEIGQGCNEWAKMVVCRLCASISVQDDPSGTIRHRRSGTVTARDVGKTQANIGDTSVGSSLSTRSDMTAKAVKLEPSRVQSGARASEELSGLSEGDEAVTWKPDTFEGAELLSHLGEQRSGVSLQDEDQRVRLVGGTFICRVKTQEQKQALAGLLEIGLYVGMSMLLESSFLTDSDAARPKVVKIPTRTTSAVEPPSRGASLDPLSIRSRSSSHATIDASQRSLSHGSLGSRDGQDSAADGAGQSHGSDLAPSKTGARKWTKSLWGMIGQHAQGSAEPEADIFGGRPGASDGHEAGTQRSSLTMHRYHTEEDANTSTRRSLFKAGEEPKQTIAARKAALFASVSSNSAPNTPQGGRGSAANANGAHINKPHRLVGRLMNAFSRPASDAPQKETPPSTSAVTSAPRSDMAQSQASASTQAALEANLRSSRTQAQQVQQIPETIFPVHAPSPAALSTSPELSLLQCYQYQQSAHQTIFPTAAYLAAFHRLQALRFLADQRREHVTFASPSHGISASGDLLPFVGVQKPMPSAWSVISSRSQQPQPAQLASTPIQLLSYELLSGDGSAVGLCREEVAFYQRLSNNRDVPLGQVIEELSIRACALEADRDAIIKTTESRIASNKHNPNGGKDRTGQSAAQNQGINAVYGMPEQRLQFVHGRCRIKIVATVLPPNVCGDESEAQPIPDAEEKSQTTEERPQVNGAARLTSSQATISRDSDVSAIAAVSHTDKEVANTAFAVAETAVRAAESGASRPLIDQKGSGSTSGIWMWNASAKSGWQGKAVPMSESTYLLSFARYLEAVSYHPALRRAAGLEPADAKAYGGLSDVQQQLRQGRSEDARSIAEGPNLLRFFRSGRSLVKVHVQPLVVYDLQIEGPCLRTSSDRRRERKQKQAQAEKRRFKQLAEETRLEIQRFFASIKRNTTRLEDVFVSRELDEAGRTIRGKAGMPLVSADSKPVPAAGVTAASSDSTVSDQLAQPLNLLTNLRTSLRADEFELYEALQRTLYLDGINDIRKAFADRAKSAKNRLAAWTRKHLNKKEQADFGNSVYDEPEYVKAGLRAFPGSCYIIRDDEPLSIIAFSLSSRDFRSEMGTLGDRKQDAAGYMGSSNEEHVMQWRSGVVDDSDAASTAGAGSSISSAASTTTTNTATSASSLLKDKAMRKVPLSQLDPDKDDVFFDAEPVRAALKRKKRARESSILSLTLRRVGSTISDSQGGSYRTVTANSLPASSASSFKGRDDDDDDDDDDDGDNDADDDDDDEDRRTKNSVTKHDEGRRSSFTRETGNRPSASPHTRGLDITPSRRTSASRFDDPSPSPSPKMPELRNSGSVSALRRTFELRSQSSFSSIPDRKSSIQAGASTISTTSAETTFQAQVTPVSGRPASLASIFSSSQPGSDVANSRIGRTSEASAPRAIPQSSSASRRPSGAAQTPSAAEIALSVGDLPALSEDGSSPRKHAAQPSGTSAGVAGADAHSMVSNSTLPGSQAAESPHIKHNLMHGTTKISCVSWFAEEFAALRERWGVEHDFAHSLARCSPWAATGGKSKSAFFKTADERFIAKQLLTVWSVDEKEAFLEFAPAYIRYMMNSAVNACPTLLVKIAGVYSIKIKDTKSGETKLKMNVMLLENLWAGDGGKSIRFDLKGIRDRKVKLSAQQQHDLEQAATQAVADGQPLLNVPGAAKSSTTQGAATAAWNAGMQSAANGEVKGSTADTNEQTGGKGGNASGVRVDEASKAAGNTTGGEDEAKAGSGSSSSAVWWDSEWIARYRHRAFVAETQKELFYRALQNDTRFLTASNVMDYSLLLGVMERPIRADDMYPAAARSAVGGAGGAGVGAAEDEAEAEDEVAEMPSIRCRIVDFLGAFTLAKQLESSSKKALKAQDAKANVTILPPSEYASRFLSAMDSYLVGTPCQPRLDARYGFDRMCDEAASAGAAGAAGAAGKGVADGGAVRMPRLASVL